MAKRPLSLTIIGWFMIISPLISLYSVLTLPTNPMAAKLYAQSPIPLSGHMAFGVIGAMVSVAAGYGVLKGYPWSRWLYVGWTIMALIFSLLTVQIVSIFILSVLFLAVIGFFLFRPAANAWFNRAAAAGE